MEEKRMVSFEIRTLNNRIKRSIIAAQPPELDEFTVVHSWALRYFYENRDTDIFQRDFETFFSIRRPTATRILQSMEKKGLIARKSVVSDARLKKIIPTPKAMQRYSLIVQGLQEMETRLSYGIDDDELNAFFQTLDKIKQNLEVTNA